MNTFVGESLRSWNAIIIQSLFHTPRFDPVSIRRVLLIELNRLGDVVNALPAARTLRQRIPHVELSMAVDARYAPLVAMEPAIDRVLGVRDTRGMWEYRGLSRSARELDVDLVLSLSPVRRNALAALVTRRRYAAGYFRGIAWGPNFARSNRIRSIGVQLARAERFGSENICQTALKVTRALGFPDAERAFQFENIRMPDDPQAVELPPGVHSPYVVVHPFAGWKYRAWPPASLRTFLAMVIGRTGFQVVVVGWGSDEEQIATTVLDFHKGPRVVRCHSPGFPLFVRLLQRCAAFVGTDSGPLHLAAAVGARPVGLFGPASPELTGPVHAKGRFLRHAVKCSPCSQRRCVRPKESCMDLVRGGEAFEALMDIVTPAHV